VFHEETQAEEGDREELLFYDEAELQGNVAVEQGNVKEKLAQISNFGYELLGHFILTEEIWWTE